MQSIKFALLVAGTVLFSAVSLQAQKITIKSGSLEFLKGQSIVNVEYVYDGMGVGKFTREQDYLDKKVAEYNAKEPGKGDNWLKLWKADRETRFQPKFEELMNKILTERKTGLRISPTAKDAKYTLIVKTTFTEPGYNVGVWRGDALINFDAVVVETANRNQELCVVTVERSPGRQAFGGDYDAGVRIAESYAKGGKELAHFIAKKGLK